MSSIHQLLAKLIDILSISCSPLDSLEPRRQKSLHF